MKALIVDNHSNFIDSLKSLLKDFDVTVKSYLELKVEDADTCDLILLSGGHSRAAVNQDPKVNRVEIEIIKTTSKPLIGICYGAQLIAEAFGGRIEHLEDKALGTRNITLLTDFLNYKKGHNLQVHESHKFAIKKLPDSIIPIAQSNDGFEIIKVKNKEIFGFQFHPEIGEAKSMGDEIFIKLLKQINNE